MLANVFRKKKSILLLIIALKLSCKHAADAPNSNSNSRARSTVSNSNSASAANNLKALKLADGCFTDISGKVSPIKYQQLPNVPYGLTTTGIAIPNVNISNKCSAGLNLTEGATPFAPTVFEGTPQKEKVNYSLIIDPTITYYKDKFEGFLDDATNGESLRSKLSNLDIQAPVGGVLLTFTGLLDPSSDLTTRTEDAIFFMDPAHNGIPNYQCEEKYFIAKTFRPFNSDDIDSIQTIVCTSNPETDAALRLSFSEIVFNMLTGTSLAEQQDLSALNIADLKTLLEPYISKYKSRSTPTAVTIGDSSSTPNGASGPTPLTLKTVNTSSIPLTFTPTSTGTYIPRVCINLYEGHDSTNLLTSLKIQSQTLFLNPSWIGKTLFMEYGICAPISSSSSTHTLGELFTSYLNGIFDPFGDYDFINPVKKNLTFIYKAPAADTAENSVANANFKTQSIDGLNKGLMINAMKNHLEALSSIKFFIITEPVLSWFKNENLTYLKIPINDRQTYDPIENYIKILRPKFYDEKIRLCALNPNFYWDSYYTNSCSWASFKSQCNNIQGTFVLKRDKSTQCLINTEISCTKLGYIWSDGKCVKGSSFTPNPNYFDGKYIVSLENASTGTLTATPLPIETYLSSLEASNPSPEMQRTLAQITGQNNEDVNLDVLATILDFAPGASLNLITLGGFRDFFRKTPDKSIKFEDEYKIYNPPKKNANLANKSKQTYGNTKKSIARKRLEVGLFAATIASLVGAVIAVEIIAWTGGFNTSNKNSSYPKNPNSGEKYPNRAQYNLCNYRDSLIKLTTGTLGDNANINFNKCLTETATIVGNK